MSEQVSFFGISQAGWNKQGLPSRRGNRDGGAQVGVTQLPDRPAHGLAWLAFVLIAKPLAAPQRSHRLGLDGQLCRGAFWCFCGEDGSLDLFSLPFCGRHSGQVSFFDGRVRGIHLSFSFLNSWNCSDFLCLEFMLVIFFLEVVHLIFKMAGMNLFSVLSWFLNILTVPVVAAQVLIIERSREPFLFLLMLLGFLIFDYQWFFSPKELFHLSKPFFCLDFVNVWYIFIIHFLRHSSGFIAMYSFILKYRNLRKTRSSSTYFFSSCKLGTASCHFMQRPDPSASVSARTTWVPLLRLRRDATYWEWQ